MNRLGQNLARSSGADRVFTFQVIYSHEVNAKAFPGGFIAVYSGVIRVENMKANLPQCWPTKSLTSMPGIGSVLAGAFLVASVCCGVQMLKAL